MKHLLIILIVISFGAYAQGTNSEWDYDEENFNEEVKGSINFINAERVDDLLIKKKRRSSAMSSHVYTLILHVRARARLYAGHLCERQSNYKTGATPASAKVCEYVFA